MKTNIFAVIYRNYIKPNCETEFQRAWNEIANYFIAHCGALGSCLHKTDDDLWVAYSRWPSKAVRDAAWPGQNAPNDALPDAIKKSIATLKACMDQTRKLPDIEMELVEDLLN